MAYTSWSVVFGEQPSAAKWNILGTNDASFNDGTGIADGAIKPEHLINGSSTLNTWAWDSWTPTWGGSFTVGNATVTARYCQIGKTVNFRIHLTGGGTTSGAGGIVPTFTFPVTTAANYATITPIGLVRLGGAAASPGYVRISSTTAGDLAFWSTSGATATDAGMPETFGSGDTFNITGAYEAA